MKDGQSPSSEENEESFVLVPKRWLESLSRNQERILSILEKNTSTTLQSIGDYISEPEAKKLLKRGTTWFWQMRTSGQLASTKIGGTNYYDKNDIIRMLDENKKEIVGLPFQKKIA